MDKIFGLSLLMFSFVGFVSADIGGADCFMMGGSSGYGAMGFGWLIMLLVVTVLVLLVIWLSKQIWSNNSKRKK